MTYFLNDNERKAVKQVIALGKEWGFGNLIDRLRMAWVKYLLEGYKDMSIKAALLGAGIIDSDRIKGCEKLGKEKLIDFITVYSGEE